MKKHFFSLVLVVAAVACGQTSTSTPQADAGAAAPAASAKPTAETSVVASDSGAAPVWDSTRAHSWDRNLFALIPQIDACLAQSPRTRMISYAGTYHGAVLVRMQGEQTAVDCRVNNGVAQIGVHNDALDPPGDGDAEFVRGPGPNPGGECYVAPEVRDANGNVLGWMLDTEGC